jgi:hypothetical protein
MIFPQTKESHSPLPCLSPGCTVSDSLRKDMPAYPPHAGSRHGCVMPVLNSNKDRCNLPMNIPRSLRSRPVRVYHVNDCSNLHKSTPVFTSSTFPSSTCFLNSTCFAKCHSLASLASQFPHRQKEGTARLMMSRLSSGKALVLLKRSRGASLIPIRIRRRFKTGETVEARVKLSSRMMAKLTIHWW